MEQSPKQSPAAVEPVADLIERLTKERDELRTYAHEATKAITGLTAGGSEYFGRKIGDIYTADLPFCVNHIRERMNKDFERFLTERIAKHAAEAEVSELRAKLAEARAAIDFYADEANWNDGGFEETSPGVIYHTAPSAIDGGRRARAVQGAGQS